jgi:hypothetical protein
MASKPQRLINQFAAFSGTGKVQAEHNVPMDNADLDTRDKVEISVEDVVARRVIMDCENRFADDETTDTRLKRFTFTYAVVTAQILARWAGYFFGAATAPTGTPANEVQTLARTGTVSGGTFTITFALEGRTGTTAPIPWNATAAQIAAALVKQPSTIGNLIKAGDVTVSGDWIAGIVITFVNRLKRADLPLLVIGAGSLTGASAGISVTETTAGDQNFHEFSNSTDDAKAEFSFALGFKTGNLATEKYYNAVCERFDPVLNRTGDVGLTVSVLANYEAEQVAGFTVPPCVNYQPMKTSECRVQIGSEWKTLDIFQQTMTNNDSVPVDQDTFGFDSLDPEQHERGDQPAYSISAQLFGAVNDPDDAVAVAVRAESKIAYTTHFGMPGNRFSLLAPNTKVKPQSNSRQYAGPRNRSVIALDGLPLRDGSSSPVFAEAQIDQGTAFLTT